MAHLASSRLDELRSYLGRFSSVLVCFSGGIDSALLLAVANEQLSGKAVGLVAVSPSLPESERKEAQVLADKLSADVRFVESNELDDPLYARNHEDRCFHCKTELYRIAEEKRLAWGLDVILNGTNIDDLGDYRPGLDAAKQAKVLSPFLDLRFSKQDIRDAAQALGLPIWNKPAAACLSSRLPYGTEVTRARLAQIDALETELKRMGFRQVRVRWHDTIARIELALTELSRVTAEPGLRKSIVEAGMAQGFKYVTLDLAGYRQGSHNEVLIGRSLKLVD